jgi:hypothetical protein
VMRDAIVRQLLDEVNINTSYVHTRS